jgi:putative long chain acyl-CoA synthase
MQGYWADPAATERALRPGPYPWERILYTGDLFRADEDGDLWLVDHASALFRTPHGHLGSFPILDALGDLDPIDLAVVYGVPDPDSDLDLAVAAVSLRRGRDLDAESLTGALCVLDSDERPDIVHVVDRIPVTTWYRPSAAELRAAGMPHGDRVWRRAGDEYVPADRITAEATS